MGPSGEDKMTNMIQNLRVAALASFALLAFALMAAPAPALAETKEYTIVIKDHVFEPAEVRVPAGEKIRLIVLNQDITPEEFESHDLNLEKIIGGGRKGTFVFGPLDPGTYKFFGEFNEDSAQGVVIAE